MIDKALRGDTQYWRWISFLALLAVLGLIAYLWQFGADVDYSGLSQEVPWGLFIVNYAFLVGIATSVAVVLILYKLHGQSDLEIVVPLAAFLSVGAVVSSGLFIAMDIGQPSRILNIYLHPNLTSPFVWDAIVLPVLLVLSLVVGWQFVDAKRKEMPFPSWLGMLIVALIIWAIGTRTVTSLVYVGLPARPIWNSAILVPKLFASSFAVGPALLVLLCLAVRGRSGLQIPNTAFRKLGTVTAYAVAANLLLRLVEVVQALYSGQPEILNHLKYLYIGIEGQYGLAICSWLSIAATIVAFGSLVTWLSVPSRVWLITGSVAVVVGAWIQEFSEIVGGFAPSPVGIAVGYWPTFIELGLSVSAYALGALIVVVLYNIVSRVAMDLAEQA